MAREITPKSFTVYRLDELTEEAQQRALELHAERLGGEWRDQSDLDDVGDTILYALAEALKAPGWDTFGEGDFPGITNVEVKGWDLDRGWRLELSGHLTRENAPSLPWVDGLEYVTLEDRRWGTAQWFVTNDDAPDGLDTEPMKAAIEAAIEAALRAGQRAMEYKAGEEYAREDIEANEREFYADGRLYTGGNQ